MNNKNYSTLIVVAGHAVYTGKDFTNIYDDNNWYLYPFQKGEPVFYIEHIKSGIRISSENPDSILIFSGTQSRSEAGPLSEASGYWKVADSQNWFGSYDVKERCITEEFARDSFENLFFSFCRFKEYCGGYPEKVIMVSWKFKERRFNLHRKTVGINNYCFEGVNNPVDLITAQKGEESAVDDYNKNPTGNSGTLLEKRLSRNPFNLHHPYREICPEYSEKF